jgi:biotin carboxyl carrier protein
MEYELFVAGEKVTVDAEFSGRELTVNSGTEKVSYQVVDLGAGRYLLRRDGNNYRLTTIKTDNKVMVLTDKATHVFNLPARKDQDSIGGAGDDEGDRSKVTAPMPGKVIKILVREGDTVSPKQRMLIVEAMKMENPVVAPFKAEVAKVNCSEGELVDSDTLLIELNELE